MTLEACKQICMTTQGKQCLVPFTDTDSRMVVSSCFWQSEKQDSLECPTKRGRTEASDMKMTTVTFGECQMDHCKALDTCGTESSDTSGELVGISVPALFTSSYHYSINTNCSFKYTSPGEAKYYRFTFYRLDVHCQDAVKVGDASQMFSYNLCRDATSFGKSIFTLCMPASDVVLDFNTGNSNDASSLTQRSGMMATYAQIEKSQCQIESEETACTLPGGRTVSQPTTLKSKFYPLPYPADSSCLWNIDTVNENMLIKFSVIEIDLGITVDELQVEDSVVISDDFDRNLTLLPGIAKPYLVFYSMSSTAKVVFESGSYYNWHKTFQLEVEFLSLTDNLTQIADAGFCTSQPEKEICKFPFTYNDKEYEFCDYLEDEDEAPSCVSYKNNKVSCDTSNTACIKQFPKFTGYEVNYINNTQVELSWDVDNKFWEFFQIFINGELAVDELVTKTSNVTLPSNVETILVEIKVIEFLLSRRSLHLTLMPSVGLDVGTYSNAGDITIKWGSDQSFSSVKQSVQNKTDPVLNELAGNLGVDLDVVDASISAEDRQYVSNSLVSGLIYQFALSGQSVEEKAFNFTMPPNELTNFDLTQSSDGITFSGKLNEQTICSSMQLDVQTSASPTARKRRSTSASLTKLCSLADQCIKSATGDYVIDLSELMLEPGECYSISVTSSTNDISSDPATTLFCTQPPQVKKDTFEINLSPSTGALSLKWTRPQPDNFDFYVLEISHCLKCGCDTVEEYQSGGYIITEEEFVLEDLEPGVKHTVTVKTRKVFPNGEVKESEKTEFIFDTYPPNATLVTISQHNFTLYLDWASPALDDEQSSETSVGDWSNFRVTYFKSADETEEKTVQYRKIGASLEFPLEFPDSAAIYEIQMATISCNEDKISIWGTLSQMSAPQVAPSDAFSIERATNNTHHLYQVHCNLVESSNPSIEFSFFRIGNNEIGYKKTPCNQDNSYVGFTGQYKSNFVYTLEVSTALTDTGSLVTEIFAKPIELIITTYPNSSVFEYVPSDVLTFSTIEVKYNFTSVLKSIKSVILTVQSIEDRGKAPDVTEKDVTDLTGTITSTGHLRNETYDVTLTLTSNNDHDFDVLKFSTEPITFTSATDFTPGEVGYNSASFLVQDDLDPTMTQYHVVVKDESASQSQRRELIFEKSEICDQSQPPKCKLFVHGLESATSYSFVFKSILNGFTSINNVSIERSTLSITGAANLTDFSETTLTIRLSTLPFLINSSIDYASIIVGVDNINLNNWGSVFNTWNQVLGNTERKKRSAANDAWVYQAGPRMPYPPSDNETSFFYYKDSILTIKLGFDSVETCEAVAFCNGPLKADTKYYVRILGEDQSVSIREIFGPLEELVTQKSENVSTASLGSVGLIAFIILAVVMLILVVLIVVYCLRHGRRSRSSRARSEPRQAPLQRHYMSDPSPYLIDELGARVSRYREVDDHGFDNVDARSSDYVEYDPQHLGDSFSSNTSARFVTVTAAPTTSSSPPTDIPRLQAHFRSGPIFMRNPVANLGRDNRGL